MLYDGSWGRSRSTRHNFGRSRNCFIRNSFAGPRKWPRCRDRATRRIKATDRAKPWSQATVPPSSFAVRFTHCSLLCNLATTDSLQRDTLTPLPRVIMPIGYMSGNWVTTYTHDCISTHVSCFTCWILRRSVSSSFASFFFLSKFKSFATPHSDRINLNHHCPHLKHIWWMFGVFNSFVSRDEIFLIYIVRAEFQGKVSISPCKN